MTYRSVVRAQPNLEKRRLPLAFCFLVLLAAINVLATLLSLSAGGIGLLLW
jgi:hypothetical protein